MSFEAAIASAGLLPKKGVIADGRIHRCGTEAKPKSDNGWYVLHPDGHGAWGDWGTGSGDPIGTMKGDRTTTHQIDDRVREQMRRQWAQQKQIRARARRDMLRFWSACKPLRGMHPYLETKGLSLVGCGGVRVGDLPATQYRDAVPGLLVIPMNVGLSLVSVQMIQPDGEKRFWKDVPAGGAYHVIDRPGGSVVTILAEGFATGLAVYQCTTNTRVIVAFNCGNFESVIEKVKPRGNMVIAADNDWRTKIKRGFNPGIEKAEAIASRIGCGVAYPEDIEGSDWADAIKQWGDGCAKRVERQLLAKAQYVFDEG